MKENEKKQDPVQLAYWESWRHVAPGMLKEIKGGNLNGKTDINPIWRFRAMTETFGPCGFGWTIREVERWTNECAGEVGAFVKVELRINLGGTWSEPIEGTGGSKLCGKGRGEGLNDEAWKMATTDAISVACKSLGMAADVYTGQQSHKDEDQKKSCGDYASKYESRNYTQNSTRSTAPAQTTAPTVQAQNRAVSAPVVRTREGEGVQVAQNPTGKYRIELVQVTTGRCKTIIAKQALRDYDDLLDWQDGIDAIRERYEVDDDAMKEIEKRAVALRNDMLDQQARDALK